MGSFPESDYRTVAWDIGGIAQPTKNICEIHAKIGYGINSLVFSRPMPIMRLAFLVLLAVAQFSCGSSIDIEEASVIRTFVDSNLKKLFDHVEFKEKPLKIIYIGGVTSGFQPRWQHRFAELGQAVMPDTEESFLRRNDREYALNPHLSFSLTHRIIPEAKAKRVIDQEGWDFFYREYPASHGIIWFSRVGFDKGRAQALFYFSNHWQSGAAEGWLVLMKKEDGTWHEAGRRMIWVS